MIDTHVHVVSDDDGRFPLRLASVGTFWFSDTRRFTVEDLLREMDGAGVERVVIVHCFPAYSYDCSYTVYAAASYPQRCRAVVQVDAANPQAQEQLTRSSLDPAVAGVRILALFDPALLGAQSAPVWAAARAGDLTVELVVGGLAGVADVVAAAAPTPVVVHGALPELATLVDTGHQPDLRDLAALDNCFLKLSTGVIESLDFADDPAPLGLAAARLFGAERLTWGTNFPATDSMPYRDNVEVGRRLTASLGAADREMLLGGTGEKLWFRTRATPGTSETGRRTPPREH